MTADEIVTVIDMLTAAWPWAEWGEKTMALWCDALNDVDAHDAAQAARKVILRSQEALSTVAAAMGVQR